MYLDCMTFMWECNVFRCFDSKYPEFSSCGRIRFRGYPKVVCVSVCIKQGQHKE